MEDFFSSVGIPASVVETLELPMLVRLLLASVLGGAIGMERELSGKPAGLRTNLLICVGAALLTELSVRVAGAGTDGGFRSDPARLAAQIVSGLGFIGAGTILHARGRVTGLTTAATLWVVAAIGIAVGAQAYIAAIGSTVLVIGTLFALVKLEGTLERRSVHGRYAFTVDPSAEALDSLVAALRGMDLHVTVEGVDKGREHFEAVLRLIGPKQAHEKAVRHATAEPRVRKFGRA